MNNIFCEVYTPAGFEFSIMKNDLLDGSNFNIAMYNEKSELNMKIAHNNLYDNILRICNAHHHALIFQVDFYSQKYCFFLTQLQKSREEGNTFYTLNVNAIGFENYFDPHTIINHTIFYDDLNFNSTNFKLPTNFNHIYYHNTISTNILRTIYEDNLINPDQRVKGHTPSEKDSTRKISFKTIFNVYGFGNEKKVNMSIEKTTLEDLKSKLYAYLDPNQAYICQTFMTDDTLNLTFKPNETWFYDTPVQVIRFSETFDIDTFTQSGIVESTADDYSSASTANSNFVGSHPNEFIATTSPISGTTEDPILPNNPEYLTSLTDKLNQELKDKRALNKIDFDIKLNDDDFSKLRPGDVIQLENQTLNINGIYMIASIATTYEHFIKTTVIDKLTTI